MEPGHEEAHAFRESQRPFAPRKDEALPKHLKLLLRQFPGAVWSTDTELRLTYTYGSVVDESLGLNRVAGLSVYDFVSSHDPAEPAVARHLSALAGRSETFRYFFKEKCYQITIEPLRDEHGAIVGTIGAGVDVTPSFEAEQRLRESEARLREAQMVAHIGTFEWRVKDNAIVWSKELRSIFNLTSEQAPRTFEDYLRLVHPDDVEATQGAIFAAYRAGKAFAYDHRIVTPGGVRYVHVRGAAIAGESGEVDRLTGVVWDITEQTQTTLQLQATVSLLQATLDSTADGLLVVDAAGKVSTYNRRFLSLWQIPERLANRNDDEALLKYVLDQLESPQQFMAGVHELYAHPDRESFDVLHFKDGRVYERFSMPQRREGQIMGRVWSFRDVTVRERLLRHATFLADATRLLGSLDVEQALESVARLSIPVLGDGCAVDLMNAGGPRRLLAISRDPRRPMATELRRALAKGHATIFRLGAQWYMSVPLTHKDQLVGAFTFAAAPNREYAEADLELAEELARRTSLALSNARLYQGAQDALRARDEFLAIAAHEIRGPITAIHLAAQTLQSGKLDAAGQAIALGTIEREDRRLGRFVTELLDLGRLRGGLLQFTFEPVDLAEIVRDTVSGMGAEIAKSGSSVSVATSGSVWGEWDHTRVEQIVSNLLSNAIKFGLGRPIAIEVAETEKTATLTVTDHGMGIPLPMRSRIFQPFERGVSVRNYGGLGLGLYIVKSIVDAFGGRINLESEEQRGTRISIELPKRAEVPPG